MLLLNIGKIYKGVTILGAEIMAPGFLAPPHQAWSTAWQYRLSSGSISGLTLELLTQNHILCRLTKSTGVWYYLKLS
jgi:hypothetical protein